MAGYDRVQPAGIPLAQSPVQQATYTAAVSSCAVSPSSCLESALAKTSNCCCCMQAPVDFVPCSKACRITVVLAYLSPVQDSSVQDSSSKEAVAMQHHCLLAPSRLPAMVCTSQWCTFCLQILVGNKSDMADEKRAVPYSKGQGLADEYGIRFFETSAKDNINVEEVS